AIPSSTRKRWGRYAAPRRISASHRKAPPNPRFAGRRETASSFSGGAPPRPVDRQTRRIKLGSSPMSDRHDRLASMLDAKREELFHVLSREFGERLGEDLTGTQDEKIEIGDRSVAVLG